MLLGPNLEITGRASKDNDLTTLMSITLSIQRIAVLLLARDVRPFVGGLETYLGSFKGRHSKKGVLELI